MKKIYAFSLLFFVCCGLTSCFFIFQPERDGDNISDYTPITMTRAELRESVKVQAPRALKTTGKIYVYGSYLFINERYEGVHIVNNTNPANPQKIAFIAVPGCLDMAVKNNILYVDNATDLVALDINAPTAPVVTKRIEEIFPINTVSPDGFSYNLSNDKIIVGWTRN